MADVSPDQPARKRKRWPWPLRVLRALLILLVLVLIVVQIVLWTDWPRRIAIQQIQKQAGLSAEIESLSISWTGRTQLRGVTLSLPLASAPFVTVDQLDVEHTPLLLIPFGFGLDEVNLDNATLDVRQRQDGTWNLQQVAANLPKGDPSTPSRPTIAVPDLSGKNVTLQVRRRDGSTATLSNLTLVGRHGTPLQYALTVDSPGVLSIDGTLGLTRTISHQFKLNLQRLPDDLAAMLNLKPDAAAADLTWAGRRNDQGLDGTLQLHAVQLKQFRAGGAVHLYTGGDAALTAEPKGLQITATDRPQTLRLTGGRVLIGDTVRLEQIRGQLDDGRIALAGSVDPDTLASELWAGWEELQQSDVRTSGYATMKLSRGFTGRLNADLDVTASAVMPSGSASGSLAIRAEGDSAESIDARIETRPLTWRGRNGRELALPAFDGVVQSRGRALELLSFRPRDASVGQFDARARFDLQNQLWFATVEARDFQTARLKWQGVAAPLDLSLNAFGTLQYYEIKQIYARYQTVMLWADGFYDRSVPKPLALNTQIWYDPQPGDLEDAHVEGLTSVAKVNGTLWPRELAITGTAKANKLAIRDREIGDLNLRITAAVKDRSVSINTDRMTFLGGQWDIEGGGKIGSGEPVKVVVKFSDLLLDRLGDTADVDGLSGKLTYGKLTFNLSSRRLRDVTMEGLVDGVSPAFKGHGAEKLSAKLTMQRGGDLTAGSVLSQGAGTIESTTTLNLLRPTQIKHESTLNNWPAVSAEQSRAAYDIQATLKGKALAEVDVATKRVTSQADITGPITRGDQPLGDVTLSAKTDNALITLTSLKVNTLDGQATAHGHVDLSKPNAAQLEATYVKLALDQLAWLSPQLKDVRGRYSGSLFIKPSTDPRALGPLEANFVAQPTDGAFRSVPIGNIVIAGFADYRSPKDFRVVSEQGLIHLAGGTVRPFARFSKHPDRGMTQLITLDLKDLNLAPIVQAAKDDGEPVVGLVSGNVSVFGSLRSLETVSGEASFSLSRSDLVNFKPVAFLYNIMNVGTAGTDPRGTGNLSMRLEQATLTITNADYFNRGVYISAFGPIESVNTLPDSPLKLNLVGSLQPWRDIKLPFFSDANKIFGVLQSTATAVVAEGTLRDPKPRQAAISELGDAFRTILLGKVKDEK